MTVRERILSIGIDRGGWDNLVLAILARAAVRSGGYICFANVHSLYLASRNPELGRALGGAFRVAPDGMPLARWLSCTGDRQERLDGMSAFPSLLEVAASQELSVAFFGADRATLDAVRAKVERELPALRVVAAIAPEQGSVPFPSDADSVRRLRESGAKLVFVALGCPKQELWMALHSESIPAVMLGVGNAFRTWLGWEKRPPRWVRLACLEWVFRLIQDPSRLWKRYLVSNAWFLASLPPTALRGLFLRRKIR